MELSFEEQQIITARRTQNALNQKRIRYAVLVVELTAKWVQWSQKDGDGLTFSTFIDNFDAPNHIPVEFEDHVKTLYEAIKAMLDTADNHANKLLK